MFPRDFFYFKFYNMILMYADVIAKMRYCYATPKHSGHSSKAAVLLQKHKFFLLIAYTLTMPLLHLTPKKNQTQQLQKPRKSLTVKHICQSLTSSS